MDFYKNGLPLNEFPKLTQTSTSFLRNTALKAKRKKTSARMQKDSGSSDTTFDKSSACWIMSALAATTASAFLINRN
jgi:hypothetical protein